MAGHFAIDRPDFLEMEIDVQHLFYTGYGRMNACRMRGRAGRSGWVAGSAGKRLPVLRNGCPIPYSSGRRRRSKFLFPEGSGAGISTPSASADPLLAAVVRSSIVHLAFGSLAAPTPAWPCGDGSGASSGTVSSCVSTLAPPSSSSSSISAACLAAASATGLTARLTVWQRLSEETRGRGEGEQCGKPMNNGIQSGTAGAL